MLDFGTVFGIAFFGFWVYCMVDVVMSDGTEVRNLPKWVWLGVVVFLWLIGAVLWWMLGRPHRPFSAGDSLDRATERYPGRPLTARRVRSSPVERPEEESVIRARIEERDRLLARWEEEDRRKRAAPGAVELPAEHRSPPDAV